MIVRVLCTLLFSALLSRPAFASGGEILGTIYLQLSTVAACIIVPSFFTKGWVNRSFIAGMVLLGFIIVWLITWDMPYSATIVLINILSVGLPVLGLVIALFIISIRDKKRGTFIYGNHWGRTKTLRDSYDDIRSRITDPPSWWDQNGVPRYCEFDPENRPNIYSNECVLFLIACQQCGQEYRVCFVGRAPKLAEKIGNKSLDYGDPPNACNEDCFSGNTMTSIPMRVLEYWHRPHKIDGRLNAQWFRDHTLEIDVMPDRLKTIPDLIINPRT